MLVQRAADAFSLGQGRQPAQQTDEQPVAVYRRMPVEAAIEGRMQLTRAPEVGGVQHDVVGVGRVFPGDAVEGDADEVRGQFHGEDRR